MLADEILKEIKEKNYACLVCHSEIGPRSPIWTCGNCYRSFDLPCAREWSHKDSSRPGGWRCPHCLKSQGHRKPQYRCWCSKAKHPEPFAGRPHSCGQTCGAKLGCPHPCTMICHPGPHNACVAIGPPIKCWCGSSQVHTFCEKTPYKGFSCGNRCSRQLKCGHECRRKCHKGACGRCHVKVLAQCWCSNTTKKIECSRLDSGGHFGCGSTCNVFLDCGKCKCERKCHPESTHECPKKPKSSERCPCGKHLIRELLGRDRDSCDEERPICESICGRVLTCGHHCSSSCHNGHCPPCSVVRKEPCACGSTVQKVKCGEEVPPCHTKCGGLLTCGRHRCHRECCLFRPSHHGRSKIITDLDDLTSHRTADEAVLHTCVRDCNRILECGAHRCQRQCHDGTCGPCLRSTSEDYICACGRTILLAPIRCGTELPDCPYECSRNRACGHPAGHSCHDDGDCPPCKYQVQRRCTCGKNVVSQYCHLVNVERDLPPHCRTACHQIKACGHRCKRICHGGLCDPECSESCGRLNESCGHTCEEKCHPGRECPPCEKQLIARCPCRRLASPYECGENLELFCFNECYNNEPQYAEVVVSAYRDSPNWTVALEKEIREFVANGGKTHWFRPMRRSRRKIVHYFIEHFGLDGESMDEGAARSVCAYRTSSTWLPKVSLRRSLELKKIHGIHSAEDSSNGGGDPDPDDLPVGPSIEKLELKSDVETDADGWQVARGSNTAGVSVQSSPYRFQESSAFSVLLSEQ